METNETVIVDQPQNVPQEVKGVSAAPITIINQIPNSESASQANFTRPGILLRTNRGLTKNLVLGILTLGIYPLVGECHISEELNMVVSKYDARHTMHFIWIVLFFSWLTLGIAPLIWYHRTSDRMNYELRRRRIPYDFGVSDFWLWSVLGSLILIGPFIYVHKRMKAMNLINADYNLKG